MPMATMPRVLRRARPFAVAHASAARSIVGSPLRPQSCLVPTQACKRSLTTANDPNELSPASPNPLAGLNIQMSDDPEESLQGLAAMAEASDEISEEVAPTPEADNDAVLGPVDPFAISLPETSPFHGIEPTRANSVWEVYTSLSTLQFSRLTPADFEFALVTQKRAPVQHILPRRQRIFGDFMRRVETENPDVAAQFPQTFHEWWTRANDPQAPAAGLVEAPTNADAAAATAPSPIALPTDPNRFWPTRPIIMPFFASLAYAGKVAIAERLLQYFKRWGYVPNITNYSILINGLYHTDQPADRAIALFEAMIQQGIAPDYSSYYSIIRFCAFRGLMPQALVLYEQMIVRGLEPGSNIHAVIATAYLRQGRSDDAQRFVRKVGTVRSELDRLAMNTLWATIFQVTRSTTSKQQLVSLFRQMLRSGVYPHKVHLAHLRLSPFAILDIMQQENIPVQGRTLTAFMYRAFKARDFRQAMQLLEYMKQHNIVASNYFYNAFIEAFVYAGQMSPAFSLYDDMVKNEIRPNHITYKALISGVARAGNLDGAYKLLDIMTANRILPDLYMYNTILTHCARLGRHEAALKLYRRLKQETLIPDEITYECVIAALCRQRLFDKTLTSTAEQVWEFYKQLKADQITPSHAIFQLVLPVLCRSDQFDHAWTVWSDMRALNLLPTTAICNYMMVLCEKHQDTDKVLSIWALMIAKGVLRDPISFKVYLSCCHRANLPTQVIEDVHRQLAQKDANIKVSAQNLIQLATILAHRGQWEDLLKLVRQWGDFGLLMESNHLKTLLNMAQAHGSSKQVDAAIVQIVHDQYPESLL